MGAAARLLMSLKREVVGVALDARAPVAGASDAAIQGSLGDDAVGASSACGDILPDHVAIVAETELLLAVAYDGTVGGASGVTGSATASRGGG
jgi:hypothetical protein